MTEGVDLWYSPVIEENLVDIIVYKCTWPWLDAFYKIQSDCRHYGLTLKELKLCLWRLSKDIFCTFLRLHSRAATNDYFNN